MYDHVYVHDAYVFQMILYADLLYGALKLHKSSFCLLLWNLDMHRRAEERETGVGGAGGRNGSPSTLSQLFLIYDVTCVIMSIYHDKEQATREEHLVVPQEKNWKELPMGMTLKIDQSDPLVPWRVSKHSVLRFSYCQVFFPQHNKVRTLGRASDSRRKILKQLRQKIMT